MRRHTASGSAIGHLPAVLVDEHLPWTVLRDADGSDGGEVDLLADAGELDLIRATLRRAGWVEVPSWGRGSHTFFRTYDASGDRWWTLDVVTELAFGPQQQYVTDLADACLRRSSPSGGVPVLADTDQFWALLLHVLLDKRGAPGRHADRLRVLGRTGAPTADWRALLDGLPGAPTTEALRAAAVRADDRELADLARQLRSAWLRAHPLSALQRVAQSQGARATTKVRVARRRRGVTVALLGPDGAGKSTLSRELAATLPLPVRQVYAGHYQGTGGGSRGLPGAGLARRVVRQVGIGVLGAWHVRRGRVTVFDRYAYDAALPRSGSGLKTRLRRSVLARMSVRPDLVVVLDADSRTLFARSGEHGEATLEQQRSAYLELAATLRQSVVVDAGRPADDVRRTVTDVVWSSCTARWRVHR